jgi:cleavage stimulation factor subunit 3
MSTTEPALPTEDVEVGPGDRTQPTEEILSALGIDSPMEDEPQEPPPSEYDALNAHLAENPHNPDAWRRLVRVAEESGDVEKISATYEALLKQYPNNVRMIRAVPPPTSFDTFIGHRANSVYQPFRECRIYL